MPILTTPRLRLRPHQPVDFKAFFSWISHPQVTHYLSWGLTERTQAQERFEQILNDAQSPRRQQYFFVIESQTAPPQFMGDCGFTLSENQSAGMGYFLLPEFWGQGYATEAAIELLRFGFTELKLAQITATCSSLNEASARVLRKAGLEPDPDYVAHDLQAGVPTARLRFCISQHQWTAPRPQT